MPEQYLIQIKIDDTEEARSRVLEFMEKEKGRLPPGECGHDRNRPHQNLLGGGHQVLWLRQDSLSDFQKLIFKLGDLHRWQRMQVRNPAGKHLNKWKILTAELENNKKLLEKTPHVRALVKAEIFRLKPSVEALKKSEGMARVQVVFLLRDK